MRSRFMALGAMPAVALVLAACGGTEETTTTTAAAGASMAGTLTVQQSHEGPGGTRHGLERLR
ncbi:MAG: hypothetical protein M5U22_21285 [Thermoleophilia bacterium]|nr:hypothetical protein [Thermoleophilia bacterium]